jgi:hypothetical protein
VADAEMADRGDDAELTELPGRGLTGRGLTGPGVTGAELADPG